MAETSGIGRTLVNCSAQKIKWLNNMCIKNLFLNWFIHLRILCSKLYCLDIEPCGTHHAPIQSYRSNSVWKVICKYFNAEIPVPIQYSKKELIISCIEWFGYPRIPKYTICYCKRHLKNHLLVCYAFS